MHTLLCHSAVANAPALQASLFCGRGHSSSRTGATSIVDHRDAMHTAILGQVVGDGIVLRDTVVPHRYHPSVPTEANLKLGLVDVVEQRCQEALTVTAGHPQHVRGEMAIDV